MMLKEIFINLLLDESGSIGISGRRRGRHFIGASGGTPANGYVAEDDTTSYVAPDGSTFYVQES